MAGFEQGTLLDMQLQVDSQAVAPGRGAERGHRWRSIAVGRLKWGCWLGDTNSWLAAADPYDDYAQGLLDRRRELASTFR